MAGPREDSSSRVFFSFMKYLSLIFIFIILNSLIAEAQLVDRRSEVESRRKVGLLNLKMPYVPQKVDYSIELGSFWERQSLYWVGGAVEQNIGECWLFGTDNCQQFIGLHIASSGRDGLTLGLYQMSLRWQYVSLPKTYSPFFRLIGGVNIRNGAGESKAYGTGALGLGVNVVLTPVVDLRVEARGGTSQDKIYGVGFLGFHIKTERFIEVFAKKLKDIGLDLFSETAEGAKTLLKETQKGVKEVIDIPGRLMQPKDQKIKDSKDLESGPEKN